MQHLNKCVLIPQEKYERLLKRSETIEKSPTLQEGEGLHDKTVDRLPNTPPKLRQHRDLLNGLLMDTKERFRSDARGNLLYKRSSDLSKDYKNKLERPEDELKLAASEQSSKDLFTSERIRRALPPGINSSVGKNVKKKKKRPYQWISL